MSADRTSFHAGLTPDDVVQAAAALTAERQLSGWSIRDLAEVLGVTASVIYHHVGGKDLLARRVVETALHGLELPDPALGWQPWFRQLLIGLRPLLTRYPGTATWLLMHGPALPPLVPVIDTGIRLLQQAGFGTRSTLAYATLLNTAMLTLAMSDQRAEHEDDGPRDHASMMREFDRLGTDSPGVTLLRSTMIEPYTRGAGRAEAERAAYYLSVVEVTLAGVAAVLRGAPDVGTTSAATPT